MSLADKIKMEFSLSALVEYTPRILADGETPPDARTLIETGVQENIVLAVGRLISIELKNCDDLAGVYVQAGMGRDDYKMVLSLTFPEAYKEQPTQKQKAIYETLERFARRIMKDARDPEAMTLYMDHVSRDMNIHALAPDMIATLATLTHTKYRGDQSALGHIYMANQLIDRLEYDARALRLN